MTMGSRHRCASLALAAALAIGWTSPAAAVPIVVNYTDGAGEGFWDPSLGAARRAAFEHAAGIWAGLLDGSVTVVVDAAMDPMGGTGTGAILGAAGPTSIHRDFSGAPVAGTWYVAALANQLTGTDLWTGSAEISARFNGDVDNGTVLGSVDWYYGFDGNPGGDIDFVSVVLHEIGHGLGFLDLISDSTGAWYLDYPDAYGRNLWRDGVGQFTALTNAQRLAALTSGQVVWTGASAVAEHGGSVPIYAPASYQAGSSISHWSTVLTPNELMEPFYTGPSADPGMALAALVDIGWPLDGSPSTTISSTSSTTSTSATTSTTTTLPPIDPFLCYKAKPTRGTEPVPHTAVVLDDDLDGTVNAEVVKPKAICSPATLDGVPPVDGNTHLGGYTVAARRHSPRSTILVSHPFGSVVVDTVAAERLLVPSAMSDLGAPAPPAAASHDLDHFRCYKIRLVRGSPTPYKGVVVELGDTLTPSKRFALKKPKTLCAPVDSGGGFKNAAGHLVCYKLAAVRGEPRHVKQSGLYVANELAVHQVDTKKEDILCVPAVITIFD